MTFDGERSDGRLTAIEDLAASPALDEALEAAPEDFAGRMRAGMALALAGLAELTRLAQVSDAPREHADALALALTRVDEALGAAMRAAHAGGALAGRD